MSFFEMAFGKSDGSEGGEKYERPIHSRFTILEDGNQGNMLFRADHPEKLTGKERRPYFIFYFTDASVLDVFNEFDHPVQVKKSGEGFEATVWCEKDEANENKDLATMEEMVKQNGGRILDEEDLREPKKEHDKSEV